MKYCKMDGAGNDFIIIDNILSMLPEDSFPALAKKLCDRETSLGADGLMVIAVPQAGSQADCRMIFYNSDGSIGEMCGNGSRCLCRYLRDHGIAGENQLIETAAGMVFGEHLEGETYRVRLNDPTVIKKDLILPIASENFKQSGHVSAKGPVTAFVEFRTDYVELGSPGLPHLVVPYEGPSASLCGSSHLENSDPEQLRAIGQLLRSHRLLQKGANVTFYEIHDRDTVSAVTYERGVEDFTLACGTGAASTVLILTLRGLVSGRAVRVLMPGGELLVDILKKEGPGGDSVGADTGSTSLLLTGPARVIAEGEI